MGQGQRKIGNNKVRNKIKRSYKGKHRRKDADTLFDDMHERAEKLNNQPVDYDLPGLGQHYCIPCGKYYITEEALSIHQKSKVHKRAVKMIKEEPYRGPDAEARVDNGMDKTKKIAQMKTDQEEGTVAATSSAPVVAAMNTDA
eukprot:TRINITY_DN1704_c0_g1_i1.p1 TRINITY_DN1704_c0_g1~~TRINITY_DN1704_c0_g1_i1.p1  ORF type:complete len:155 (-),score=49.68 TRINITY_DN1704_c0_g1_i1:426-854(-)